MYEKKIKNNKKKKKKKKEIYKHNAGVRIYIS